MPRSHRPLLAPLRAACPLPGLLCLLLVVLTGCRGKILQKPAPEHWTDPDPVLPPGSPSPSPIPATERDQVTIRRNPDNLPEYAGPTGTVEGRIAVTGDPPPAIPEGDFARCPEARATRNTLFREGSPLPNGARPLLDTLVMITGYSGFFLPEAQPTHTLLLADCAEAPQVVDITFGQQLAILNRTSVFLAPELLSVPTLPLRIARPGGEPILLTPDRPGHFQLRDRFHNEFLNAEVFVLLHPLHSTTGLDGVYRIHGVPAGTLDLSAYHPHLQQLQRLSIDVHEGKVTHQDLSFVFRDPKQPSSTTRSAPASQKPSS